ncbi:MAG: hypothetical protein WAV85_14135 [Rhodoferax sp.]
MHNQKETVSACDTDRSDPNQLTAPIVADSVASSKAFKTAQARAAIAGHQLTQTASGFMLTRWKYSHHCDDLHTVELLLNRIGAPK